MLIYSPFSHAYLTPFPSPCFLSEQEAVLELMLDKHSPLLLNFICSPSAYIPHLRYRDHFSKSVLAQLGSHFL